MFWLIFKDMALRAEIIKRNCEMENFITDKCSILYYNNNISYINKCRTFVRNVSNLNDIILRAKIRVLVFSPPPVRGSVLLPVLFQACILIVFVLF